MKGITLSLFGNATQSQCQKSYKLFVKFLDTSPNDEKWQATVTDELAEVQQKLEEIQKELERKLSVHELSETIDELYDRAAVLHIYAKLLCLYAKYITRMNNKIAVFNKVDAAYADAPRAYCREPEVDEYQKAFLRYRLVQLDSGSQETPLESFTKWQEQEYEAKLTQEQQKVFKAEIDAFYKFLRNVNAKESLEAFSARSALKKLVYAVEIACDANTISEGVAKNAKDINPRNNGLHNEVQKTFALAYTTIFKIINVYEKIVEEFLGNKKLSVQTP